MREINAFLMIMLFAIGFLSCSEDDNEPSGPNPADSVDLPLSDEDAAFLATLPDTIIQLQDILFDDGQNAKDFLEANDPDFLETYPSGRIRKTKANSPHQQKLLFLSRMFAMGNYLVDDANHTYPSDGANSPAQTGLAYSWGSKDYNIRQIPPTESGCMDKKI